MKMDEDFFGSNLVDEFILSSTIDNRTTIHEAWSKGNFWKGDGIDSFLREFSQKVFCPKVAKIRQKKRLDSWTLSNQLY